MLRFWHRHWKVWLITATIVGLTILGTAIWLTYR